MAAHSRGRLGWRRPALAIAGLLVASSVQVAPRLAVQAGEGSCSGNPTVVQDTQPRFGLTGRFTLPRHAPIGLVVFAHGYRNSSASWVHHLVDAADHGLVAVAVDYRGLGPAPDYRGWPAQAGAQDLVTAAQYFLRRCSTINEVVLLGVSMGGNMSGLAVAQDAKRADGKTPLWDYWIDTEGVTNWVETWAEATATAPGSVYSAAAEQDIEKEAGGTPVTAPDAYRSRDVLGRTADVAASGVKGVIMIHSVEDGLVPYDQTRETSTAERAAGVPVDVYSVLRRTSARDPGHEQTTLLGDAGFGGQDPFSGHAWEGSSTHIVMTTSMSRLFALFDPTTVKPSNREFAVDGQAGIVPTP